MTFVCVLWLAYHTAAAPPALHYPWSSDWPPGAVGQGQLLRAEPIRGYFQPVQIRAPQGVKLALATNGTFADSNPSQVTGGMLVGQVYRLQVSNIPAHEGFEVYPTIEGVIKS